jgi:hypothetical protein
MPKTRGRVFDPPGRGRSCLRGGGGDSSTDRDIRRASVLARSARAGSFDCAGHGFSRRVRRRARPQTELWQWRDAMHRAGVHQARARNGSSDRGVEVAALVRPGPAGDPRGLATGAARHARAAQRNHLREAARRSARQHGAFVSATRGDRRFGAAKACANRRMPRVSPHWTGRPGGRGETGRKSQQGREQGGRQPAQSLTTKI